MRVLAIFLTLVLLAVLCGCAFVARSTGKHDIINVQLISDDHRPMSRAKFEVRGWIEQVITMRRSVKLVEGYTDENGRFSVSVPVHVGYRIVVGDIDGREDRWLGEADVERKNLSSDSPLTFTVHWQVGPFISPLLGEMPNQAPEPTSLLVTIRADARLAPSSAVAHL